MSSESKPEEERQPPTQTLVVWPFPLQNETEILQEVVESFLSEAGLGKCRIEWETGEDRTGRYNVAKLTPKKRASIPEYVDALHNKEFEGITLSCCSVIEQNSRRNRVIIRNLPFGIKESTLRRKLSEHGAERIFEIDLQQGLAFATFATPQGARAAVHLPELRIDRRPIAIDTCIGKQAYHSQLKRLSGKDDGTVPLVPLASTPEQEQERRERRQRADPCQVFVRGLPAVFEDSELIGLLRQCGRIRFVHTVRDRDTGMCRGSSFVTFRKAESAQAALELEEPTLDGTVLTILPAETRDGVVSKKEERQERASKSDPRNLSLAREGDILPKEAKEMGLSDEDIRLRNISRAFLKRELKNPNKMVSRFRLSIRNLDPSVTEAELRRACLDLARKRMRKTAEESETQPGHVQLKQVKIVRDRTKTDRDGNFRSRGFGFIEFTSHIAALSCLRALNNRRGIFGPRRPIVMFAIEDVHALRKLEASQHRGRDNINPKDDSHAPIPSEHRGRKRRAADREYSAGSGQKRARRRSPYDYQ